MKKNTQQDKCSMYQDRYFNRSRILDPTEMVIGVVLLFLRKFAMLKRVDLYSISCAIALVPQ